MARTLTVYLAADVAKFKRDMSDAGDSTHGLKGKVTGLGDTLRTNLGPAALGAAGMVGGLAIALGVDGVQAAVDDQQEVAKLTTLMKNLGIAQDTQPVLDQIDALQRLTGVSESELRPAFGRLITSVKDSDEAMGILQTAIDTSIATGKPLIDVVNAISRGYDGNTGSLKKLNAGLDNAVIKSGDMDAITKALADRFGGMAAENAKTYKGQIDKLTVGFDELKESFGQGFLDGLTGAEGGLGSITDFMKENEGNVQDFGDEVGTLAKNFASVAAKGTEARTSMIEWGRSLGNDKTGDIIATIIDNLTSLSGSLLLVVSAYDKAVDAIKRFNEISATGAYANDGSAEAAFHKPVVYFNGTPTNPNGYTSRDSIGTSKSLTTVQAIARSRTGG